MNFYKCYIEVDGWGTVYIENVDYFWASDEFEARSVYCKKYGFRKNKKGLKIECVSYHRATVKSREIKVVKTATQSRYLGGYEYSYPSTDTEYYCGNCKAKVRLPFRYCKNCNAELT